MKIEKKKNYTLLFPEKASFKEFYTCFLEQYFILQKEHLIVDFSNAINTTKEELLLFLHIAKEKKENGTSFAIVNSTISIDEFPEGFNIVPTITEAEDILEIEAIERELGF